jgi:hypothetical protein
MILDNDLDIAGEIDTITEASDTSKDTKDKKKDLNLGEEKGDNKTDVPQEDNSEVPKEDKPTSEKGSDGKGSRSTSGTHSDQSINSGLHH